MHDDDTPDDLPISAIIIQEINGTYDFSYMSKDKVAPERHISIQTICSFVDKSIKALLTNDSTYTATPVSFGIRLRTNIDD